MNIFKKVGSIIISILLWMVILLAALYTFTTLATRDQDHVASVAGFTPMVVQSDSMAPFFSAGDMILIQKCDTSKLNVGDVICFHTIIQNQYVLNTHRIAEIEQMESGSRRYTTKGDNNSISDTHVISDGDIVGKHYSTIPKVGFVMNFLSSSIGFLLVIVLPMLIFFVYQVYHLVVVSINLRKAVAVEQATAVAKAAAQAAVQSETAETLAAREEAAAALAEAKRLKAEAEAALAEAKAAKEKSDKGEG